MLEELKNSNTNELTKIMNNKKRLDNLFFYISNELSNKALSIHYRLDNNNKKLILYRFRDFIIKAIKPISNSNGIMYLYYYSSRFSNEELNSPLDIRTINFSRNTIAGYEGINRNTNYYDVNFIDDIINKITNEFSYYKLEFYAYKLDKLFDIETNQRLYTREIHFWNILKDTITIPEELVIPNKPYYYYSDEEDMKPISNNKEIFLLDWLDTKLYMNIFKGTLIKVGIFNLITVYQLYDEYAGSYYIFRKNNQLKVYYKGTIFLADDNDDNNKYITTLLNLIQSDSNELYTNNKSLKNILSKEHFEEQDKEIIFNSYNIALNNSNDLLKRYYWALVEGNLE